MVLRHSGKLLSTHPQSQIHMVLSAPHSHGLLYTIIKVVSTLEVRQSSPQFQHLLRQGKILWLDPGAYGADDLLY